MSRYTDDPAGDWDSYCQEQDDWLKSRPVCCVCKEHIADDHYFDIGGEKWCQECIDATKEWID